MSIYLYTGRGADSFCVEKTTQSLKTYLGDEFSKVVPINDPSYIISKQWFKDVKAIVIPGGSALELYGGLNVPGCKKVADFVHQGGAYLGLCSGVYAACPYSFKYHKDMPAFDGVAHIPVLEQAQLSGPKFSQFGARGVQESFGVSTAKLVPVQFEPDSTPFYTFWNGGGAMRSTNPSHQPIALYSDNASEIAALVQKPLEDRGVVVVSNVHPEMRLTDVELQTYPFTEEQRKAYLDSLSQQEEFFERLCKAANI